LDYLQTLPLTPNPIVFLETLLSNIKNEVGSFQHFLSKSKNSVQIKLRSEINIEKNSLLPDLSKIKDLEKNLQKIVDNELRMEVENSPLYEFIHNEKITPEFLKLAKACKAEAKISDIKKPDGTEFNSNAEREEFVVSYYENIYKLPGNSLPIPENAIEDFLGPTVLNHPVVASSRLSAAEAGGLEAGITLAELDRALDESKVRTAAGPDGISNAFLKKFWFLLRIPVHNYTLFCFEEGRLSPALSNGSIRIIPKKGDLSQIKNWRPISLLNCIYKIVSKTINNRLKTVTDRILSRAQKGFTSSRFLQEVLINVIETIAKCNNENAAGLILAIDEAKAFDSLSHDFMEKTWNFFGFGENFKKMLSTITRGRASCVIMDTGYSRLFKIETGTLQGDSPSPLIFNFNQQIAIFKLELDPRITAIAFNFIIPRPIFPATPPFEHESNRETSKVDGFADDTTTMVRCTIENLIILKNILREFGTLSGLKCNFRENKCNAGRQQRRSYCRNAGTGFHICRRTVSIRVKN
jgi:hypothetical protein